MHNMTKVVKATLIVSQPNCEPHLSCTHSSYEAVYRAELKILKFCVYFLAIVSAPIRTILWQLEKEESALLLEHVR